MRTCVNCHTPLPVEGRFCAICGTSAESGHVCPPDPVAELQERLARTLAGRYEITRLLGRGGMAVVFLAQDLMLERQVAIKVLPPDMAFDTKLIPRFQQEAKTAAKLDHPNIIPIYRVESEAGLDYFVMKYVTGGSLEQVLEQGPLQIELARRVLCQAALALGHAHKRGIVHRDVKPANIMLESDGRVVLTDFGISKALEGGSGFTGTGAIIGTPHYMAPEQAKGSQVDGRADQYSLAVVGHQVLTGKQPFEGSSHSILYKHVFEPPPRVFETRPDAPADLVAALDRALGKDPERRFATMED
ncbi:MAG: protein kinase, partial [Geminicoccaceae bacterium]|nr:protein kinase [Geminicoccaceae bacterium]